MPKDGGGYAFELYFVDPEFMLADRSLRPSVTNLIGVLVDPDDYSATRLSSIRYYTPPETVPFQKAVLQLGLIQHITHPEKHQLPDLLSSNEMSAGELDTLTSISIDPQEVRLISKFTPKKIMERLLVEENPGPEITNQISATLQVLGGAAHLLIDSSKQQGWRELKPYLKRSRSSKNAI